MDTQSEDEKISLLMAMGFPDVDVISQALKASRGDINDAVSMLTENTLESYATKEDLSKVTEDVSRLFHSPYLFKSKITHGLF